MDIQKICKLLRYALQFIIVYLVLRYLPQINMDTCRASVTALILISLCVILEFIYSKMLIITEDTFEVDSCNSCNSNIEKFTEPVGASEPLYNIAQTSNVIPQIPTTPTTQQTIPQLQQVSKEPAMAEVLKTQQYPIPPRPPVQELQPSVEMRPLPHGIPYAEQVQQEQNFFPGAGTTMDTKPFYLAGHDKSMDKELEKNRKYAKEREAALEESAVSLGKMEHPYQTPGSKSEKNKPMQYDPKNDGYIVNEMDYSDYDYNFLPVARGYKSSPEDYGYSYMVPEAWFSNPPRAPLCRTTLREEVMPSLSNGEVAYLKDFHVASKITGPMEINTAYINEKLNAGR